MLKRLCLLCSFVLFAPLSANADNRDDAGMAVCYDVERLLNTLVTYTRSSCLPAGGNHGSISFIIVAGRSIFNLEATKKPWLLTAVAGVGKAPNDRANAKADMIWLSDSSLMANRTGYELSAHIAKSLQRRIKANKIGLEQMYDDISKRMVRKEIK